MEVLLRDLRYALRTMRRDAGFCAVAVGILGLGIGANTAIFSVANTVLLRPLPFRDPARLVWIANTGNSGLSGVTSRVANYRDWRSMNQSFEDLSAYFPFSDYRYYNLIGAGEPERLSGYRVAQNFFDLLGVRPMLGRNFEDEECKWNGRPAAILTYGLWQRRFGGDPNVIGRAITLNDQSTTIVGVMPETFDFANVFVPGARIDLFVPFPITDETDRWGNTLSVVGRLKPGATLPQARAEFELLVDRLHKAHPERGTRWGARLTPLQEQVSGRVRSALIVLLCAVGAVLLIACANLSNLLLARAASRRKEVAVRVALGAGRGRLIRQMLTESTSLACCGAVVGVAIALAATRSLAGLQAMNIPLLHAVRVDGVALAFAMAAALLTGLVFGIVPALQASRGDLHDGLKESARGSSEGRRGGWIRDALVVSEIALACVLLVGAGLLIRSFLHVMEVDLGFQVSRAAAWSIETGDRFNNGTKEADFYRRLEEAVLAVPGVEAAGVNDCLPFGKNRSWGVTALGVQYQPGQFPLAFPRIIDAGYIPAMKIPLRAGRNFTVHDTTDTERSVLLNQALARRLWPDRDAVGQQVVITDRKPWRVIGVVGNVRHSSLEEEGGNEVYLPVSQLEASSVDLVVRTRLTPEAIAQDVRAAIRKVDPTLPTAGFRTLESVVHRAVSPRRFVVLLLSGFAALALVLASLGIYGVVSYSVAQRTQEIGIRMALGASAGRVQWGVLRQTLVLALTGAAIGAAASAVTVRLIASLLYGVQPGDMVTFGGMLLVLTLVAAVAGYVPALRASRIDPMSALRSE
ncbi:MAG TPA: ABC transporter permease [Candidatus Acidoferrales bacterium]|nr:ABC transporter permease [Candidatus Acidoferrales bacterium]HTS61969.1 ABC transporter permease [Candidatus Acidoferrales bacterium]